MAAIDSFHAQEAFAVLKELNSSENGLSSEEAKARLLKYGKNTLLKEIRFKTLKLLFSQFKNFFAVLLLVASALSFRFESVENGLVLLGVVILNVTVSFFQERKAEKTIERLRKMSPAKVSVIRDGKEIQVPAEELVLGDVVVLREGESVPADLQLFEVGDLKIDQAVLTGESEPTEKSAAPSALNTPLADRHNIAYVGTLVVSGSGKGVVVKAGVETEFAKIAAFVQEQEERSLLLERISRLGVWLTAFSAFLAVLILLLALYREDSLAHAINFAIATFVSAVPESLPTTTTLALAITALRLSRKRVLVRHLPTAEALSGIDLFAFDKTGTLTLNEMAVAKISLPGRSFEVTGTGFSSQGDILENGKKVNTQKDEAVSDFISAGAYSSAALIFPAEGDHGDRFVMRGDPTEGAFLILAEKAGVKISAKQGLKEDFAFTSARRMRTRVFERGGNLVSYSLGAPEEILRRCRSYRKNGKRIPLSLNQKDVFERESRDVAHEGYRVLAVATRTWKGDPKNQENAEKDLTFLGIAGLLDKPKERVTETFKALRKAGITPVIITGDHPGTTLAVARSLGLEAGEKSLISGDQLDTLSDQDIKSVARTVSLYARISPTQKYRLVSIFKEMGMRVAVSGDGVNDAPALKKADVGVVMGKKGTDVSKDAADLIILDDDIEAVLPAIREARTLYDNIKKFFTFLISGNFVELLIIAAALAMGLPQPLTTLQILWINLVTDALPAFALVYDPPRTHVMETGPRDLGRGMIRPVFLYAFILGTIALIGEAILFLTFVKDIALARTILFTAAVAFELFIVFSIRTSGPFWRAAFTNPYLILAFLGSFGLQFGAIYFRPLSAVMETVSLGVEHWVLIMTFVGISFGVTEIFKAVGRGRSWSLFGPLHKHA